MKRTLLILVAVLLVSIALISQTAVTGSPSSSVIVFGTVQAIAQNTTNYFSPYAAYGSASTETPVANRAPMDMVISNLYCNTDVAPASGQTITFTLRTGKTTDSALTCQETSAGATCQDTSHSVLIPAGTFYTFKVVASATSGNFIPHCSAKVTLPTY